MVVINGMMKAKSGRSTSEATKEIPNETTVHRWCVRLYAWFSRRTPVRFHCWYRHDGTRSHFRGDRPMVAKNVRFFFCVIAAELAHWAVTKYERWRR